MASYLRRRSSMIFSRARFLPVLLLVGLPCCAAEISVPNLTATPGQLLATAVTLSTEGALMGGIQFDLEWDTNVGVQLAVGHEVVHSGKFLYTAQLTANSIRILIVGTDQGAFSDGELLRLFIAAGTNIGSSQLRLTNVVGAATDGSAIAVGASSATIRVDPGPSGVSLLPESVLNAASLISGPIAPGEIVTFLGAFGISPDSSASVGATVNGAAATVLYALGNQINATIPFGLDASSPANVEVRSQNQPIARVAIPTSNAAPAIFTQSGTGVGLGAILNEDYTLNSADTPALAGSIIMVYGTGFGPLIPAAVDGQPGVLSSTALPVSAQVGGVPAEILYAGSAPGLPGGVVQINIRIPNEVQSGDSVSLWLSVGSFEIPAGVRVAVR